MTVEEIIQDKIGIPIAEIKPTDNFFNDYNCDDLDLIEIIMECEYQFHIIIDDSVACFIQTVEELINSVKKELKTI